MDEGLTSRAILGDCMDVMREYPDKYFDLAVVDPPYGGGGVILRDKNRQGSADASMPIKVTRTGGKWAAKYAKKS